MQVWLSGAQPLSVGVGLHAAPAENPGAPSGRFQVDVWVAALAHQQPSPAALAAAGFLPLLTHGWSGRGSRCLLQVGISQETGTWVVRRAIQSAADEPDVVVVVASRLRVRPLQWRRLQIEWHQLANPRAEGAEGPGDAAEPEQQPKVTVTLRYTDGEAIEDVLELPPCECRGGYPAPLEHLLDPRLSGFDLGGGGFTGCVSGALAEGLPLRPELPLPCRPPGSAAAGEDRIHGLGALHAGRTIARPLRSLRELLYCEPEELAGGGLLRSRIPLTEDQLPPAGKRLLLVCHDMKGGYFLDSDPQLVARPPQAAGDAVAEDQDPAFKAPFSAPDAIPFNFRFWPHTDVFVYFSHNRVTIPPVGWIEAAHRHGARALGTLIFEHREGSQELAAMLGGRDRLAEGGELLEPAVEKLAQLAAALGFDGWLLNFEAPIPQALAPAALRFVERLQQRCRQLLGSRSYVVWYDALCYPSCQVRWQCQLNDANEAFFRRADAIFLDYHWEAEYPEASQAAVGRLAGRHPQQVFFGVDAFGRGSFGGGGLGLVTAADHVVKTSDCSLAVFAPGWTHESSKSLSEALLSEVKLWAPGSAGSGLGQNEVPLFKPELEGWSRANGGHGWKVAELPPHEDPQSSAPDPCVAATSSYQWCQLTQKFPLEQVFGMSAAELLFQGAGHIIFEVWHKGIDAQGWVYSIKLKTIDSEGEVLYSHGPEQADSQPEWALYQHRLPLTSTVSAIEITIAGKDTKYWAGHFGTRFARALLRLDVDVGNGDARAAGRPASVPSRPKHRSDPWEAGAAVQAGLVKHFPPRPPGFFRWGCLDWYTFCPGWGLAGVFSRGALLLSQAAAGVLPRGRPGVFIKVLDCQPAPGGVIRPPKRLRAAAPAARLLAWSNPRFQDCQLALHPDLRKGLPLRRPLAQDRQQDPIHFEACITGHTAFDGSHALRLSVGDGPKLAALDADALGHKLYRDPEGRSTPRIAFFPLLRWSWPRDESELRELLLGDGPQAEGPAGPEEGKQDEDDPALEQAFMLSYSAASPSQTAAVALMLHIVDVRTGIARDLLCAENRVQRARTLEQQAELEGYPLQPQQFAAEHIEWVKAALESSEQPGAFQARYWRLVSAIGRLRPHETVSGVSVALLTPNTQASQPVSAYLGHVSLRRLDLAGQPELREMVPASGSPLTIHSRILDTLGDPLLQNPEILPPSLRALLPRADLNLKAEVTLGSVQPRIMHLTVAWDAPSFAQDLPADLFAEVGGATRWLGRARLGDRLWFTDDFCPPEGLNGAPLGVGQVRLVTADGSLRASVDLRWR